MSPLSNILQFDLTSTPSRLCQGRMLVHTTNPSHKDCSTFRLIASTYIPRAYKGTNISQKVIYFLTSIDADL